MTGASKVSIFVYPFTGLLYGKGNFIIDEPSLQKIFDTLDYIIIVLFLEK